MKILLAILAALLLAASLFADYKWRRWMAARKDERRDETRR
jgi:sensor domain CHASE-containing protein